MDAGNIKNEWFSGRSKFSFCLLLTCIFWSIAVFHCAFYEIEGQHYGLFKIAIQDPDDGHIRGCVAYPNPDHMKPIATSASSSSPHLIINDLNGNHNLFAYSTEDDIYLYFSTSQSVGQVLGLLGYITFCFSTFLFIYVQTFGNKTSDRSSPESHALQQRLAAINAKMWFAGKLLINFSFLFLLGMFSFAKFGRCNEDDKENLLLDVPPWQCRLGPDGYVAMGTIPLVVMNIALSWQIQPSLMPTVMTNNSATGGSSMDDHLGGEGTSDNVPDYDDIERTLVQEGRIKLPKPSRSKSTSSYDDNEKSGFLAGATPNRSQSLELPPVSSEKRVFQNKNKKLQKISEKPSVGTSSADRDDRSSSSSSSSEAKKRSMIYKNLSKEVSKDITGIDKMIDEFDSDLSEALDELDYITSDDGDSDSGDDDSSSSSHDDAKNKSKKKHKKANAHARAMAEEIKNKKMLASSNTEREEEDDDENLLNFGGSQGGGRSLGNSRRGLGNSRRSKGSRKR